MGKDVRVGGAMMREVEVDDSNLVTSLIDRAEEVEGEVTKVTVAGRAAEACTSDK